MEWALFNSDDSLWKQIVESKYSGWRELCEEEDKCDSFWWGDLRKCCCDQNGEN